MSNEHNIRYAPIVLFVYKRAGHTRGTLESLAKCIDAKNTTLYIFSDGSKNQDINSEEYRQISEVRSLIHEPLWKEAFANVVIKESDVNKGLANSIIGGVTSVINEYGNVITLEDDLVVAPNFIVYMNEMLRAFRDDSRVFAIAGWSYPLPDVARHDRDVWLYYRACSWGWATWKNRWDKVIWDSDEAGYARKLSDKEWCKKFSRGGNDLPGMLQRQLDGKIDSWAIRWNAAASEMDMMTVYPKVPVILNNGRDGSGTNCGENHVQQADFAPEKVNYYVEQIKPNDSLIRSAWLFDSDTFSKKVTRNLKTIFVEHKVPNVIKKIFK